MKQNLKPDAQARLKRFVARPAQLLRAVLVDRLGATATWFALLALPLAVLILGGVDLGRAMNERARLQDALDAATLMVARSGAQTPQAMATVGSQALTPEFNANGGSATITGSSFANGPNNTVVGTAQGRFSTIILGLFIPGGQLTLSANTTVRRGQPIPVELALVLDTTGSMAGQKITDLKNAAKSLVQKLTVNPNGNVKIGIVPFAQYVNVGVGYRNQPWISVPADYTQHVTPACSTQTTRTTCQTQTYSCTQYSDGEPYQTTCSRSINCVTTPLNPPVTTCPAPYDVQHKWYGCVGSPIPYPKNVQDSDPSRVYPGFMDITCASALTPLTNVQGQVISAINQLSASGNTYIPAGLAWGFNMLSAAQPLTEAAPYDPANNNSNPHKTLVLMTDGFNSVNWNPANGNHNVAVNFAAGQTAVSANAYTTELCNNIKTQKIEVFTIAFQVTDPQIKTILQNCASDGSHYFDAADTAGLNAAFDQIANALYSIYISQ